MKWLSFLLFAAVIFCSNAVAQQPVLLEKAEVLPLSLNDQFQFRKVKTYIHRHRQDKNFLDSHDYGASVDRMIRFEEKRRSYGAITRLDQEQRYGNYITLFWHTERAANITVRLEYRQQNLGPYVQAQEIHYDNVSGTHKTEFTVTGDDFRWDGALTSWRAVLIEDGKIVALHSSYLWN